MYLASAGQVQWGTVGQWVSSAFSGGALVVALVIYGRDRNYRDQRQAENVFLTKYLITGFDEKTWSFGKVVVTGYNASDQFIRLPRLVAKAPKLKEIKDNRHLQGNYAQLLSELRMHPDNERVEAAFRPNGKDLADVDLGEPQKIILTDGKLVSHIGLLLSGNVHDPISAYLKIDPGVKFEFTLDLPVGGGYDVFFHFVDAKNQRWRRNVFTDEIVKVHYPTGKWRLKWAKRRGKL